MTESAARRSDVPAETLRDLRRTQILRAARGIVAEDGLDALTIGALEKRLAFSRGVITYHFRDKDEIIEAVLAGAIAEIDAATHAKHAAAATAAQKTRAVLEANIRGFVEHREAVRILVSFWGRKPANDRVRKLNADLHATYRRRTARLLRAGIASGEFRDVPVEPTAALIVSIVIGIAMQVYFDARAVDVDALLEQAAATLLARLSK